MSSVALNLKCTELDEDLTPIEKITVDCWRCDPDNPLAVPRTTCPDCKGSGRAPIALAPILREIREAKQELQRTAGQHDEMSLEVG